MVSQFGDGLFQAGLAGALLFNPTGPPTRWRSRGAFAVLFLPYSLLGPFAGALMDRWDRRLVLVGANLGRLVLVAAIGTLLAARAGDCVVVVWRAGRQRLCPLRRVRAVRVAAAVVPREQVVTMNSVATASGAVAAFLGATSCWCLAVVLGRADKGASAVSSSSRSHWRLRCCCRGDSRQACSARTTPGARFTDRPSTR